MTKNLQLAPFDIVPKGYSGNTLSFKPQTFDEIVALGQGNIQRMIQLLRRDERDLRKSTTKQSSKKLMIVRNKIEKLTELKKKAIRKPVFPKYRPMDFFSKGNKLMCYVGEWPDNSTKKVVESDWVQAEIIGGPSFIGTMYSLQFVVPVHSNESYLGGRGGTLSVCDARMMHRWEFDYLLTHNDYFTLWAQHAESSFRVPKTMKEYFRQNLNIIDVPA